MKKSIDYGRRSGSNDYPYVVTINRRIVARTRDERCAILLSWAMGAEGVLTDRRTLAFATAVAGLLGHRAPDLKEALGRRRQRAAVR